MKVRISNVEVKYNALKVIRIHRMLIVDTPKSTKMNISKEGKVTARYLTFYII